MWGLNVRARPITSYFPILGPSWKSTPRVKAPATPCTTDEAMLSWNPKPVVSQPPALQPQAASRIQITEPRMTVSTRYAVSLARSIRAPDMIEPVVQEKSRKAPQKTALRWSSRSGPIAADHG